MDARANLNLLQWRVPHRDQLCAELEDFPENWDEMLKEMECEGCQKIPHPTGRFICTDGHHYCNDCGNQIVENHKRSCLVKVGIDALIPKIMLKSLDDEENTSDSDSPHDEEDEDEEESQSLDKDNNVMCGKKIHKLCGSRDPIYQALFNTIDLKCPNSEDPKIRCQHVDQGKQIMKHFNTCNKSEKEKGKRQKRH